MWALQLEVYFRSGAIELLSRQEQSAHNRLPCKNLIISPIHAWQHVTQTRACLRDMFRHCSCCCFWSGVRKHSGRRACAYHYLTKHSLQEYLAYPLYQHDMSPHALRLILSTQTQHLFGTGLRSNHDSLEWNASNITVAKLWSEQKCMYGAGPLGTHKSPLNQNKPSPYIMSAYIFIFFRFIYCHHQSHKNEVCRPEHYSHARFSSLCSLCATCSDTD